MFPVWNKRWRAVARILAACAFLPLAGLLPLPARAELDPALTRAAEDPAAGTLLFQYRLFPDEEVETVRVTRNGAALEHRHTPFANNPLNTAALAVLIDTSVGSTRSPRDRTLEENKRLIQALLTQAGPSVSIGVYAFANDLTEIAPVGAPFPEIQQRIAGLRAEGLGTRLYRQGMRAVEMVAPTPAARKGLLILSDGKDEDNGFTREDFVKAALQAHVTLFAQGCPESGVDIPYLGNLEKLAAETRGLYTQARIGIPGPGERIKTDTAFAREVLASLQSGGEVRLPLDVSSKEEVTFEITVKGGKTYRYVHSPGGGSASTPVPAAAAATPTPAPTPAASATPAPTAAPRAAVSASPLPGTAPSFPSLFTPANLISGGAALLLVVAVVVLRRRAKPETAPSAPRPMPLPTAYLELQDAESKRIPLLKNANRIGRHPENDIVFTNTSVSGYHAEIYAQRDGSYRITDLGSGNGLRVNNQPVPQAILKDGDLVELGEVRFRFFRG